MVVNELINDIGDDHNGESRQEQLRGRRKCEDGHQAGEFTRVRSFGVHHLSAQPPAAVSPDEETSFRYRCRGGWFKLRFDSAHVDAHADFELLADEEGWPLLDPLDLYLVRAGES